MFKLLFDFCKIRHQAHTIYANQGLKTAILLERGFVEATPL
jgi:hypothetical protein